MAARYWAGLQRSKKQILVNKNHRFCQIFTNFIHILPVYMVFLVHIWFFSKTYFSYGSQVLGWFAKVQKQILVNKNHRFCHIFTNFIHILPVYMVFLVHIWFFSKTYFSYGSQVLGWFAKAPKTNFS